MSYDYNMVKKEAFVKEYLTVERLHIIRECILLAQERYRESQKEESYIHMSRTKANLINDYMVHNIKNKFRDDPAVHPYYKNQSFRISIADGDGAVIIRFKKMDKRMRVHNVPTQQALAFNEQPTLFGPSVNINAGYVANGLDNKVVVACPENNFNNYWVWEIEQTSINSDSTMIVPFPTPPTSPTHTERRAVPRREKEKGHEDTK